MIKEIYSFDLYEEFIKSFSGSSVFADPHFEFDNDNLYNSLRNDNKKAYIVSECKRQEKSRPVLEKNQTTCA